MTTRFTLDESLKRASVTVMPGLQATTVAETILRLTQQRPDLGGWDWIIDIRAPHEKATADQLDQIAQAFNPARSKQSYTIFVSEDPTAHDRTSLMDTKFPDRRNLVAKTMDEAVALIPRSMQRVF